MKKILISFIVLIFPPLRLKNRILNILGCRISLEAKIGFSFIYVDHLKIDDFASIGHMNFIRIERLYLFENSYIQHLNTIKGPLIVVLKNYAAIGNQNKIIRAIHPISWGKSIFKLGKLSKITSKHTIDCMRPVIFGDYSILAGYHSQIWTHGFMHAPSGKDRYRVDGSVKIGNNVYIGSASIINPGVYIASSITIGSNSAVSKSLLKQGLYVNQSLRFFEFDYQEGLQKYPSVKSSKEIGDVVHKKIC